MVYERIIERTLTTSISKVFITQYENKVTKILFTDLILEDGYDYFVAYKKCGNDKAYQIPMTDNSVWLDNYITQNVGEYKLSVIAVNDNEKTVISPTIDVVVEAGVYDPEFDTVTLPEPLNSKYAELVALIEEVEGKLERGEFKGDTGNGIQYCTFSNYKLTLHFTDGTEYTTTSIRGEKGAKGDTYTITEADYIAIGNIVTEREESRFNEYVEAKKTEFNTHTASKTTEYDSNAQTKLDSFNQNASTKTGEYNANAVTKTNEFNANATQKADEEIARINADEIVARIDEKADKSDTYTKEEVDEKVAQATPSDYEQVKEDIALLKWKTLNLATEVVDSTEAYSKSVPSNVYENALLNRLGGKTEVANQLINQMENVVNFEGATTTWNETTREISITNESRSTNYQSGSLRGALRTINDNNHKYYYRFYPNYEGLKIFYIKANGTPTELNNIFTTPTDVASWRYMYYLRLTDKWDFVNFNPIGDTKKVRVYLVDLTKRYGVGNEPTSTDDIRIKLLDQELEANGEYNEGSLVNAEVQSIVSRGANLVSNSTIKDGWYIDGSGVAYPNSGMSSVVIPIEENEKYSIIFHNASTMMRIAFVEVNPNEWSSPYPQAIIQNLSCEANHKYTITNSNHKYLFVTFWRNTSSITKEEAFNGLMIYKGEELLPYSPYFENVKPIASIIQKYFPNKMKSTNGYNGYENVNDILNLENGKAIRKIEKIVLDGVNVKCAGSFGATSNGYCVYFSTGVNGFPNIRRPLNNFISDKINYSVVSYPQLELMGFPSGSGEETTFTICLPSQITSIAEANQWFSNNPLTFYYVLSAPIETPIEQADIDYLEALKVESNGTITFEQLSTYMQIPNEESYLKRVE